jgi:hypothetical protein
VSGGYRVIMGKGPASSRDRNPYEVSWRRTVTATGIAVLSIALALGVMVPIAWLAEKLRRR